MFLEMNTNLSDLLDEFTFDRIDFDIFIKS